MHFCILAPKCLDDLKDNISCHSFVYLRYVFRVTCFIFPRHRPLSYFEMQFVTEMLEQGEVLRDFGARQENAKIEKGSGKRHI